MARSSQGSRHDASRIEICAQASWHFFSGICSLTLGKRQAQPDHANRSIRHRLSSRAIRRRRLYFSGRKNSLAVDHCQYQQGIGRLVTEPGRNILNGSGQSLWCQSESSASLVSRSTCRYGDFPQDDHSIHANFRKESSVYRGGPRNRILVERFQATVGSYARLAERGIVGCEDNDKWPIEESRQLAPVAEA